MLVFGFFLRHRRHDLRRRHPFVNAWFEADRRGFATGVFGAAWAARAVGVLHAAAGDVDRHAATHLLIAAALVVVAPRRSPVPRPGCGRCLRLGRRRTQERVGSVTGIVGAAGGLGGFLRPGHGHDLRRADHSYTVGLVLLCLTAVAALVITLSGTRIAGGGQRGLAQPPSTLRLRREGTAIPEANLIQPHRAGVRGRVLDPVGDRLAVPRPGRRRGGSIEIGRGAGQVAEAGARRFVRRRDARLGAGRGPRRRWRRRRGRRRGRRRSGCRWVTRRGPRPRRWSPGPAGCRACRRRCPVPSPRRSRRRPRRRW